MDDLLLTLHFSPLWHLCPGLIFIHSCLGSHLFFRNRDQGILQFLNENYSCSLPVFRLWETGEKVPAQVKSINQCDSEKLQHLGSSTVAKAKWSNLSTPVLGSRAEGHCRLWTTFNLAESKETLNCKILPVICFGWHSAIGWLHIHTK